jgi:hypothetical protein
MKDPRSLLSRLDEIGGSLEKTGHALALIGLGSVGIERARLDAWSDLDFFVVVEAGYKTHYLADLGWLSQVSPIVYRFANTPDGYKLLFQDDIFCEFAVFEPAELQAIPFAPGRVVWKQPQIDPGIGVPALKKRPAEVHTQAWLVGEALTNLYVGLCRFRRGEMLSAQRFIQHYAVDRLLELAGTIEPEAPVFQDPYAPERRFEQRFPQLSQELPRFIQGYTRSPASALAILAFLEAHFEVNPAMASLIRRLGENS